MLSENRPNTRPPLPDLKRLRAVVFDLDGTLYDARFMKFSMPCRNLCHLRQLKAERTVRHILSGLYFEDENRFFDRFFESIALLSHTSIEKCRVWYYQKYLPRMAAAIAAHPQAVRPHMQEICAALRSRGIRIAVLSDYGCIERKLKALNIHPEWIDVYDESAALGGLKPCPQTFSNLAEKLHARPNEVLVIGDREDTDGGCLRVEMPFIHLVEAVASPVGASEYGTFCQMTWSEIVTYLTSDESESAPHERTDRRRRPQTTARAATSHSRTRPKGQNAEDDDFHTQREKNEDI